MKTLQTFSRNLFIAMTLCLLIWASVEAQPGADFWTLKVGNTWTYSGPGYTRQDAVLYPDSSTFSPVTTYVVSSSAGTDQVSIWYSMNQSEIKEWQEVGSDPALGQLTLRFNEGVLWARNPIIVGDHWITQTNGMASAPAGTLPFTLAMDGTVLSQEVVILPTGTYKAYKFRHVVSIWANNMNESVTYDTWFVPYLGIVKRQGEAGETENLSSINFTVPTTFLDVPMDYFAYNHVNAIATAGITGGCAAGPPPQFCPGDGITRGEMAVFIETSLQRQVAPCTGRFIDVPPTHSFCGFIEKLAADGITGGCTATQFCPDAPVTRGQMAAFIEAALGHAATSCTGRFGDVPAGHPFCRFIERLADDAITGGCGGVNFCPDKPVTRAEMAVFLVAAPEPLNP